MAKATFERAQFGETSFKITGRRIPIEADGVETATLLGGELVLAHALGGHPEVERTILASPLRNGAMAKPFLESAEMLKPFLPVHRVRFELEAQRFEGLAPLRQQPVAVDALRQHPAAQAPVLDVADGDAAMTEAFPKRFQLLQLLVPQPVVMPARLQREWICCDCVPP